MSWDVEEKENGEIVKSGVWVGTRNFGQKGRIKTVIQIYRDALAPYTELDFGNEDKVQLQRGSGANAGKIRLELDSSATHQLTAPRNTTKFLQLVIAGHGYKDAHASVPAKYTVMSAGKLEIILPDFEANK